MYIPTGETSTIQMSAPCMRFVGTAVIKKNMADSAYLRVVFSFKKLQRGSQLISKGWSINVPADVNTAVKQL